MQDVKKDPKYKFIDLKGFSGISETKKITEVDIEFQSFQERNKHTDDADPYPHGKISFSMNNNNHLRWEIPRAIFKQVKRSAQDDCDKRQKMNGKNRRFFMILTIHAGAELVARFAFHQPIDIE